MMPKAQPVIHFGHTSDPSSARSALNARPVEPSVQPPSGALLDMPLLDVVARLRPMARFQQRFLHDAEIQDFTLAQIVADPPGSWQRFCLTPGAGPTVRAAVCEVVAEALRRAGLCDEQIDRVRRHWALPFAPPADGVLIFRSARN